MLEKFLLGFDGTSLPKDFRTLLQHGLAGVAIFKRNWSTIEGLRALTEEIRSSAAGPVLIGIDQEGGNRFSLPEPFTQWPNATQLGHADDTHLTARIATAMAVELSAVGVNLSFAPMLDLHLNPGSPVTTNRSFGADPHLVAHHGAAVIHGLRGGGILSCSKHFPGHGDTKVDPHDDLPIFHGDMKRLHSMELVPFAESVGAGVSLVMTAHILLPRIHAELPASLSREILTGVLRKELHFTGVILADDLGMGAIRRRFGIGDAAVKSIQAGTDIVALCHDWSIVQPTMDAVRRAFEADEFDKNEWEESATRISIACAAADASWNPPPLSIVGDAEHRALANDAFLRLEKL